MNVLLRPIALAAVLVAAAGSGSGCAAVGAADAWVPPDWGYFDVTDHPTGGIPATVGYVVGVTAWAPVGFIVGGLLPAPADAVVGWTPGEVLGTGVGLAVGAPFHLVALPFE